jgi:hypothetical protein
MRSTVMMASMKSILLALSHPISLHEDKPPKFSGIMATKIIRSGKTRQARLKNSTKIIAKKKMQARAAQSRISCWSSASMRNRKV